MGSERSALLFTCRLKGELHMAQPAIIEVAINGVTTKERNPNVPRTPDEIATDALACFEAGAAIIHNHIDLTGISEAEAAERYLEAWRGVPGRTARCAGVPHGALRHDVEPRAPHSHRCQRAFAPGLDRSRLSQPRRPRPR